MTDLSIRRTIGFFGHNFYSATSFRPENVGASQTLGALSADELPRVDYAAVPDTAESAGYTFESRYEPISRTQRMQMVVLRKIHKNHVAVGSSHGAQLMFGQK